MKREPKRNNIPNSDFSNSKQVIFHQSSKRKLKQKTNPEGQKKRETKTDRQTEKQTHTPKDRKLNWVKEALSYFL